mgnify:CR=1 FL=1
MTEQRFVDINAITGQTTLINKTNRQMKDEILNHWQIQESLLQSYRGLFLTSQSIIFSIASIIATNPNPDKIVFLILLSLGLLLLWFWFRIGNARGLDVSYFQMLLLKTENGETIDKILTRFKEWQCKGRQEKIKILKESKLDKSKTRTTLEIIVPTIFLVLWIFLIATTFRQFFSNCI